MSVSELVCRSYIRMILLTILFSTFKMVVESGKECNETIDQCCKGYYRSLETTKCEKCLPGYIGHNCTSPCPYPTYGFACQGICNCSNDICNMSWGCRTLTTLTTGQSLETTMPKSMQPKSIEILLFIRIIGCLDILLLCAYLAVCIHDRTGQEKAMDIASARSYFSRRGAAYENIEVASFSVSGIS